MWGSVLTLERWVDIARTRPTATAAASSSRRLAQDPHGVTVSRTELLHQQQGSGIALVNGAADGVDEPDCASGGICASSRTPGARRQRQSMSAASTQTARQRILVNSTVTTGHGVLSRTRGEAQLYGFVDAPFRTDCRPEGMSAHLRTTRAYAVAATVRVWHGVRRRRSRARTP